jgi:Rrf2 family protein
VRISAKSDYALRAVIALARERAEYCKAEPLAAREGIPLRFLQNILRELRVAGIVAAHRGYFGGYRLARPASDVTVGEVLMAVNSALTASNDREVSTAWSLLEEVLRERLENTTIAEVVARVARKRGGPEPPTASNSP